jgi:photosystem II stability/assembly factor-like uncharacterized protein
MRMTRTLLVALAALAAGCNVEISDLPGDAGGAIDSGSRADVGSPVGADASAKDGSVTLADTGVAGADSSTPGQDSGPGLDSSTPIADVGGPDSAVPGEDASAAGQDAASQRDVGGAGEDAAAAGPDASSAGRDAAAPLDASTPTAWQSRGPGGGGALFVPEISPFDDQIYMATDMGGVFHTSDFGKAWTTLDFRLLLGGAFSQVRFTSDPKTLYAIPYVDNDGDAAPFISTNGGVTFTQLGDGSISPLYLEVDPSSTQRLLVSDYGTLYFSGNAGQIFSTVYTGVDSGAGLILGGSFWDGADIYVGTNDGLVVSHDNGKTFTLEPHAGIPSGEVIFSFAGAKAGGTTRFFAVTANSGDVWAGVETCEVYSSYGGVYRLEQGQASWTSQSAAVPSGHSPTYVRMSPTDIDVAYLAGSDTNAGAPSVCKTTNGGTSWSSVFLATGNANIATGWSGYQGDKNWGFGECAEGFAVSRADPNRAIITDMGFVHLTDDGGASWRQAYVNPLDQNPAGANTPKGKAYRTSGVEQTSGWWLTWADATTIFGSLTDITSVRSTDSGVSWSRDGTNGLSLNTTYQALLHPSGTLYAPTSSVHDMYMSYRLQDAQLDAGSGAVMQSTDKGAKWTSVHDFGHPVVFIAIDPSDSQSVYASVVHSTLGGIFHTAEIGKGTSAQWSKLTSPPRTEGHPYDIVVLKDGTLVTTFSGRRTSSNPVFTDSSGVFISTDHGGNWTDRSDAKMHYWTKDLVIDPNDATQNTWYVGVFQRWGAGVTQDEAGLFRTTDRGQHWSQIWAGHNVESCAVDPRDPDHLLATTETDGLWITNNLSSPTPTFAPDGEYPFAHPLRVFFNPGNPAEVWVASFGGGLRVRTY